MTFDPKEIKAGDWLEPHSGWNLINEARDELRNPSMVIDAKGDVLYGGTIFLIEMSGGDRAWFSADWFTAKATAPECSQ